MRRVRRDLAPGGSVAATLHFLAMHTGPHCISSLTLEDTTAAAAAAPQLTCVQPVSVVVEDAGAP